ncbi:MAG: c-type cytochrome [Pseudomonadota bacterium]
MSKKPAMMILIGAMLAVVGMPRAAAAEMSSLGKREYDSSCASCHGPLGKGDGPLSGYLTRKASDLTMIMRNNNGVYPFTLLSEIVDGRQSVALHGSGDMPVWGNEYNARAIEHYRDFPGAYDAESFIKARVLALVEYIHSLQAK